MYPNSRLNRLPRITRTEHWDVAELKKHLVRQVHLTARDALFEYDRNPDDRQVVIVKIIRDHLKKRFLGGSDIEDCADEVGLRRLWGVIDQIRDVFLRPELIEGIFSKNFELRNSHSPAAHGGRP